MIPTCAVLLSSLAKTVKTSLSLPPTLEELPNIGPAIAADLRAIGVRTPARLRGRDPYVLYDTLNRRTGLRHDPCVLDTFIAAVRFVEGEPARPWWAYTAERKATLAARARAGPGTTPGSSTSGRAFSKTVPPAHAAPTSMRTAALAQLRNLGPASARLLSEAGIVTVAALRKLGAVEAFRRVRKCAPGASLNLLWALEGALADRAWQDVARLDRTRLLMQLDDTR